MKQSLVGAILGFSLMAGLVAFFSHRDKSVENVAPVAAPEQAIKQRSLPVLETQPPSRRTLPPGVLKNISSRFPVTSPDAG